MVFLLLALFPFALMVGYLGRGMQRNAADATFHRVNLHQARLRRIRSRR